MQTHYQILNLPANASLREIKRSYLSLCRKLHPDVAGGENKERFQQILNAYKTLSSTSSRFQYDQTLESVPTKASASPAVSQETKILWNEILQRREQSLDQSNSEETTRQVNKGLVVIAGLFLLIGKAAFPPSGA